MGNKFYGVMQHTTTSIQGPGEDGEYYLVIRPTYGMSGDTVVLRFDTLLDVEASIRTAKCHLSTLADPTPPEEPEEFDEKMAKIGIKLQSN